MGKKCVGVKLKIILIKNSKNQPVNKQEESVRMFERLPMVNGTTSSVFGYSSYGDNIIFLKNKKNYCSHNIVILVHNESAYIRCVI